MTKRTNIQADLPVEPVPQPKTPTGKIALLLDLLNRPGGADIAEMMEATGWQKHSVRGAMSGSIKKALGLWVISEKTETGRTYRIGPRTSA